MFTYGLNLCILYIEAISNIIHLLDGCAIIVLYMYTFGSVYSFIASSVYSFIAICVLSSFNI